MSGHKGLYAKYEIIRKETGEKCDGGFVLRPVTDKAAWKACMFYSYLTHNPRLGKEIREWLYNLKLEQCIQNKGAICQQENKKQNGRKN